VDDLERRLEAFPILEGVSATLRKDLASAGKLERLEKGRVLIRQGIESSTMCFVLGGRLGVHLDDLDGSPIASISRGATVGELALLGGGVASANVVAEEESEVLILDEDSFWHLIQSSHGFAINLLIQLADRLRANNATVSANIQKRRLYERAAMFDGLTGIHNRRWLDETLHRLVRRHERGGDALCLMLIDIDHFKSVNDHFGHDAGDRVLASIAATISENLRPTDLAARFGGEEFVVLFPDTRIDYARVAAERLRGVVCEMRFAAPTGVELPRITISCGVAELRAGRTPADLLKAADLAMYEAKHGGRNRVVTEM
jgi:diguanylate cyclase (GGDEF)-like protein